MERGIKSFPYDSEFIPRAVKLERVLQLDHKEGVDVSNIVRAYS